MRIRKIGRWIALGLLMVLLLVGLMIVEKQDHASKQERARVAAQAEPLEKRRDELVALRDRRKRENYETIQGQATEQLLFLELDPLLMEEVFPTLLERQITGVLGLYEGNFPGDAGRISREDLQSLLQAGWELCLVYQGEESFSAWDAAMTERLGQAGLSKPDTLYFPENTYDTRLEEEILRCGYRTVVHHGENRLSTAAGDVTEALWRIGAHPWNYSGVKDSLEELARVRGEHCYTVSFSEGREEYTSRGFVSMLDFVEPFRENGSLMITGFTQARQLHDPEQNGKKEAEEAWRREDEELGRQIRELNQQIQEIYEQWKDGNDD